MASFVKWSENEWVNMDFIHVVFVKQMDPDCFRIIGRDHLDAEHFMTCKVFATYAKAIRYMNKYMELTK